MLKARRINDVVRVYDSKKNNNYNFTETSWQIVKAIKKHGKDKAVSKVMKLFDIDEKNAREDINTVLTNLNTLNVDIDEIPATISKLINSPRSVQIDITPRCNSECIYCFSSHRMNGKEELTTKQIFKILDDLKNLETWVVVISGGEPFLRDDIFEILDYIEKLDISFWILTNAILIDENIAKFLSKYKNLCMVQVSFDSCISEHHEIHRGRKDIFDKTVNGIKSLINYGIIPEIEMVVSKVNINDIEDSVEFLNHLGIKRVRIGPALTITGRGLSNKKDLLLNSEEIVTSGKKILGLNEKYEQKMHISPTRDFLIKIMSSQYLKNSTTCTIGRSTLYITPNGLVYPCIMNTDDNFVIGDINKHNVEYIWKNSEILKKFRKKQFDYKNKCKTCDIFSVCNCSFKKTIC